MDPTEEREPSPPEGDAAPSADDLIELPDEIASAIQAVEQEAKPRASSRRAKEATPAAGQESAEPEAPSPAEPSGAGDASAPEEDLPEDHPAIQRYRKAQADADRRAQEALDRAAAVERRLQAVERERSERETRAQEAEFERLLESDDPEDNERALALIRDNRRRQRETEPAIREAVGHAVDQRDTEQLTFAYQYREVLYPDLNNEDLNGAVETAINLAAQQGRLPLPAETFAMIAQARVKKVAAVKDGEIETLKGENTKLAERVAALEAELAGEVLEEDEGPDNPAPSSPTPIDFMATLEKATPAELLANPEKFKKQLARAGKALAR